METALYNEYTIEVFDDDDFTPNSTDNIINTYDFVHLDPEHERYRLSSKHGIKIYKDEVLVKSALVASTGAATGIYKNSFLIDEDQLVICCSDLVYSFKLPSLELNWVQEADMATCFAIYKLENGFVIHGEMSITKLDTLGNIEWKQGGADIFVTLDGEIPFEIKEDYILLRDFKNQQYKIDFKGNTLWHNVKTENTKSRSLFYSNVKFWVSFVLIILLVIFIVYKIITTIF